MLADYGRPIILLKRGCEKFRRTVAVFVDENGHFCAQTYLVGGLDGFLSGFVNADKQIAVWQQIVQKRNKFAYKTAGIIADIEYERLCALCRKLFDSDARLVSLFVGNHHREVFIELRADKLLKLSGRHPLRQLTVNGDYGLSDIESGGGRRGAVLDCEYLKFALIVELNADSDAGILVCGRELIRRILLRAHIIAPLIVNAANHC